MAEICCPYCNGRNCLKIVYAYRGIKKNNKTNFDYSDYVKKGTIHKAKKLNAKTEFDGEMIRNRLYNRHCVDCNKDFHSIGKMSILDIKKVNIILGNNQIRRRYIFDFFDDSNFRYCYKKNYVTEKTGNLTRDDVFSILKAIKDNKTNLWHGHYGDWDKFEDNYWLFKIEYYNGISDVKSGNDIYPENWISFIKIFEEIITKYSLL